jgi:hypothetical protein
MFNNGASPSLADIAAVTGSKSSENAWGDGGYLWLIVFVLFFAFGGWGNNGWSGNGAANGITPYAANAITQADLQRGFNTEAILGKIDNVNDGMRDGFYSLNGTLSNNTNNIQNAIQQSLMTGMQSANNIQSQIAQCCCDNRLENLQNANATQNMISSGFADTNYRLATDTCAITTAMAQQTQEIMQNCNANYRALHDEMVQAQLDAKDAKIAEQASAIQALNLTASQAAQNTYLINALKPSPIPSFPAANLYGGLYGTTGCSGCNGSGTIGY